MWTCAGGGAVEWVWFFVLPRGLGADTCGDQRGAVSAHPDKVDESEPDEPPVHARPRDVVRGGVVREEADDVVLHEAVEGDERSRCTTTGPAAGTQLSKFLKEEHRDTAELRRGARATNKAARASDAEEGPSQVHPEAN